MRLVKSSNTKPEMIVRKFLFANGFRYKLHDKKLAGKPDLKLTKYKTLIFVNGCFWHGHEVCKSYQMPKSNVDFWNNKIESNKKRDADNVNKLRQEGWDVLVIWECDLKAKKRNETLNNLLLYMNNKRHKPL